MNGGFCMQLKIPDYERVFRRDPEYKEYPGMDPKVVEALKKGISYLEKDYLSKNTKDDESFWKLMTLFLFWLIRNAMRNSWPITN